MRIRIAYGSEEGETLAKMVDGPVVVIDALRMSATTIVACSLGMKVIPVKSVQETVAWGKRGALTAGERDGVKIPELDIGNSPTALLNLSGMLPRYLALTTTNGVPAVLSVVGHPGEVLIGSPVNLSSLVRRIAAASPTEIGIVIAGKCGPEAEEDELTASLILARLGAEIPPGLSTPVRPEELEKRFAETRSGRKLRAAGYEDDVKLCSSVDSYPIVPVASGDGGDVTITAEGD